jgi:hypothetical protein
MAQPFETGAANYQAGIVDFNKNRPKMLLFQSFMPPG